MTGCSRRSPADVGQIERQLDRLQQRVGARVGCAALPLRAQPLDVDQARIDALARPAADELAAVLVPERAVERGLRPPGAHVCGQHVAEDRVHRVAAAVEAVRARQRRERGDEAGVEEGMAERDVLGRGQDREAPRADVQVAVARAVADPAAPAERLRGLVVGELPLQVLDDAVVKPREGRVHPPASREPAQTRRSQGERDRQRVARPRPDPSGQHASRVEPAGRSEQLVAADPGQERAVARVREERRVKVGVRGPEQPVARQAGGGDRADAVELVGRLEPDPVLQPEVGDDALLPLALRGVLRAPGSAASPGSAAGGLRAERPTSRRRGRRRSRDRPRS